MSKFSSWAGILTILALLAVTQFQNAVIEQQQSLIRVMSQNPACMYGKSNR